MEFAQRQILQEADEAKFQQSLDYLKNLDRENSYKTMREIQEQKQREREQGGQRQQ